MVHVEGIGDAQRIFGGMPQEGDRLGSSDAPVTIQVFNDMQCSDCREDFLSTIPTLAENYARPGDVQAPLPPLLQQRKRRASSASTGPRRRPNRATAGSTSTFSSATRTKPSHFGVDQDFLDSIAGGVEELNGPEWEEDLEDNGGPDGAISKRLEGYEELGRDLGIRVRQAAIVSGPNGTETLQDGPSLGQIERAIEAVQ